jgi:hypothetical protein
MDIFGSFEPIKEQDLYDFYGLASINYDDLDSDGRKFFDYQIKRFRAHYMHALKTRFAHWSKGGKAPPSVEEMVKELRNSLFNNIEDQAAQMARMGTGFNMLAAVQAMRGQAAQKVKEEHSEHKTFARNLNEFKAADYPKIAQCVIDLWEAEHNPKKVIIAIDTLNGLQHCGGYVLIDFVAGKRDPSDPEGKRVIAEILDMKRHAKTPKEFQAKMSADIRKFVKDNS